MSVVGNGEAGNAAQSFTSTGQNAFVSVNKSGFRVVDGATGDVTIEGKSNLFSGGNHAFRLEGREGDDNATSSEVTITATGENGLNEFIGNGGYGISVADLSANADASKTAGLTVTSSGSNYIYGTSAGVRAAVTIDGRIANLTIEADEESGQNFITSTSGYGVQAEGATGDSKTVNVEITGGSNAIYGGTAVSTANGAEVTVTAATGNNVIGAASGDDTVTQTGNRPVYNKLNELSYSFSLNYLLARTTYSSVASETAISATSGSKQTYTAEEGNNIVHANSTGIYAAGDATVSLKSALNNYINAVIDAAGSQTDVTLEANYNLIRAVDTGIQATAGADVSLKAGSNSITAQTDDGTVTTGIDAAGGATVSLTANDTNHIYNAETGINATGSSDDGQATQVIWTADKDNVIDATSTGIKADEGAYVYLYAKDTNNIKANTGIDAAGSQTDVTLEANYNLIRAVDTGIQATAGADVSLKAGSNSITAQTDDGTVTTGIDAAGGATVSLKASDTNHIYNAETGIKAAGTTDSANTKVELIADSGDNSIEVASTGIEATEDAQVFLTATAGSNTITAQADDEDAETTGIYAAGANVSLTAAVQNYIKAKIGIFADGENATVKEKAVSNTIEASEVGIDASSGSTVELIAENADGSEATTSGNTVTAGTTGIDAEGAKVSLIASDGDNSITADAGESEGTGIGIQATAEADVSLLATAGSNFITADTGISANEASTVTAVAASNEIATDGVGIDASGTDTKVELTANITDNVIAGNEGSAVIGINATEGAEVSLTAANLNSIAAQTGIYAERATVKEKAAGNEIEADVGIAATDNSTVVLIADSEDNSITADSTGITAKNADVFLAANSGSNSITADATGINAEDNALVSLIAFDSNEITAADGTGTSINATNKATVWLSADSNELNGLTTATDEGSIVIRGTYNTFTSKAFAENLVASALYAAENGNITVSGTKTTISVETPERENAVSAVAVYASGTGHITINGAVDITSDEGAGVAVRAVGPGEEGNSASVAINYSGASSINGKLVAADYGVLDIGLFDETDDKSGLDVEGDVTAANSGRVTLNLGTNGYLTGNVEAYNGGYASVNLGEGGVLTGSINNYLFDTDENISSGTAILTILNFPI